MRQKYLVFPSLVFLLVIASNIVGMNATAATLTVTNLNNDGPGSLRQAIIDAGNQPGADTIVFASGVTGTLPIVGTLEMNGVLNVIGPGANVLTILGNGNNIFYINRGDAIVTISGLAITNGHDGIMNYGVLTVNNCHIFKNFSAGIYNLDDGKLTVNKSTLSENNNAGIYNFRANATINDSTISDNAKAGIYSSGYNSYESTISINRTNVSGNRDRGIRSFGSLTINSSSIFNNLGGEPYNQKGGAGVFSDYAPSLTIINSTVASNESRSRCGGGIYIGGSTNITFNNNTLSGNSSEWGGALCIGDSSILNLHNTTISANTANSQGGGIYIYRGSTLLPGNNLVVGNTTTPGGNTGIEIFNDGTFSSKGYNLFGQNGISGLTNGLLATGDKILAGTVSTAIGPLANNGGPTQTYLPVSGSPAINGGNNALIPLGVKNDQRNYGPRIVGAAVDIGSVEVGAVASYPVTVVKSGGLGTVVSTPAGINCGAVCTAAFAPSSIVNLVATPAAGYSFTGWLGSCTGTSCQLTMNAAKNVTALFANIPSYALTVTKVGAGTVTSNPAGINCGVDCNETYATNSTVTLIATPAAGSAFSGWSGACTGTSRTCVVTMNAAKTATATFRTVATLSVGKTGTGAGVITGTGIYCGVDCSEIYTLNSTVTLTATPYTGSAFAKWTGCTSNPTPQQCTVTMTAAKSVFATFNATTAGKTMLTVYRVGAGLGTVTSTPAGINCGTACIAGFTSGASVILTATPTVGSSFLGWGGCTPNPTNPLQCTAVLSTARVVTANFTRPVLSIYKVGSGLVTTASNSTGIFCGTDCTEGYNLNTVVTLVAIPSVGKRFVGWGGCTADPSFPQLCTVPMNQSKTVSATFQ